MVSKINALSRAVGAVSSNGVGSLRALDKSSSQVGFKSTLVSKREIAQSRENSPALNSLELNSPKSFADSFIKRWKAAESEITQLSSKLPDDMKALVELQRSACRLHLETQLIVKVGESVSGTMRKLQQLGG